MSITIEERLRRAAELLDEVAVQPGALDLREPAFEIRREPSPVFARVAAVLLVLVTLVGAAWAVTRGGSSDSNSSASGTTGAPTVTTGAGSETTAGGASETTAASDTTSPAVETTTAGSFTESTAEAVPFPTVTLPASSDLSATPVTIAGGTTPSQWYRLQPDLDVAWLSPGNGGASQLCFRTPEIEQCQDDTFRQGYVAVKSAGGHWIIVTIDNVDQVDVGFDDGTRSSVPVTPDSQVGYRVGREVGRTPTDASMVFDGS